MKYSQGREHTAVWVSPPVAYKRRLRGSTHHGSLSQIYRENQRKTKAAYKYKYIVLQDDFRKASTANNLNAHELGAGGAVSAQWNKHYVQECTGV